MLIIPPKGISGCVIDVNQIDYVTYNNYEVLLAVKNVSGSSYMPFYWRGYSLETDMEEEFHRVCNEVNSLLTKPTIQL